MEDKKITKNDMAKIWEEGNVAEVTEIIPLVDTKSSIESEKKEVKQATENTKPAEETPAEKDNLDSNNEHELLKKRFEESRAWGHKRNSAYVNAKKKMTEFLTKLEENGNIYEDDVKEALGFFNIPDEEVAETKQAPEQQHPYVTLKENLDKEFGIFKKYAKTPHADEKYNAYFSFLPLHSKEEQERILTYLSEESADIALDHIMTTGAELYEDLYKELENQGGILPYVKSLKAKIAKIEKKNKEIETQLDETKGKVYPRSINSKVSTIEPVKQNVASSDIWQNG